VVALKLSDLDKSFILPMVLAGYNFEARLHNREDLLTDREQREYYAAYMGSDVTTPSDKLDTER
jgi:hypothetical protein